MKKIKRHMDTGFAGASYDDEIEFDDDATEDDIEEAVKDAAYGYLDLYWEEV